MLKNLFSSKSHFAVYKPVGPTSGDIVNFIKKITGIKKVGHAGTLDPLAAGVLVIGVGRQATRQLFCVVAKEKEYLATIRLGFGSTTDDAEGQKKKISVKNIPTYSAIKNTLKKFTGKIWQTPPIFSAVKIRGQTAYQLARQGREVSLAPKRVKIKKIIIIKYHWPNLTLKVTTGPGVYLRALARDLGVTLKTGGYLAGLERIRVGEFTKKKAIKIFVSSVR